MTPLPWREGLGEGVIHMPPVPRGPFPQGEGEKKAAAPAARAPAVQGTGNPYKFSPGTPGKAPYGFNPSSAACRNTGCRCVFAATILPVSSGSPSSTSVT